MSTEAITEAELAAAMAEAARRSGGTHYVMPVASAAEVAAEFFKMALSLREPEYEPGEAYVDSRGDNYLRSNIGDWVDRSGTRCGHSYPVRPLRRLVPVVADIEETCPGGC